MGHALQQMLSRSASGLRAQARQPPHTSVLVALAESLSTLRSDNVERNRAGLLEHKTRSPASSRVIFSAPRSTWLPPSQARSRRSAALTRPCPRHYEQYTSRVYARQAVMRIHPVYGKDLTPKFYCLLLFGYKSICLFDKKPDFPLLLQRSENWR